MTESVDLPMEMTEEEKEEREYWREYRRLKQARARALVVRNQTAEAYSILENIRFDFLGDTAFRDQYTKAKKGLESAISDFLLDDSYWKKRIDRHKELTPKSWKDQELISSQSQPSEMKG